MAKTFRPKFDRVLVRPLKSAAIQGGVHIPESARYMTAEGEVIAVGPGARTPSGQTLPMSTKVGDRVKYTPYTGSSFNLNGEDVLVLSERDLLGDIVDDGASEESAQATAEDAA